MAGPIITHQQKVDAEAASKVILTKLVESRFGSRCENAMFELPEPDYIPLEASADLALMSALCG